VPLGTETYKAMTQQQAEASQLENDLTKSLTDNQMAKVWRMIEIYSDPTFEI
jgi:hypothetical protein